MDFQLPLECRLIYLVQNALLSVQVDNMENQIILAKLVMQHVQAAQYQVLIVFNVRQIIIEKLAQTHAQILVVLDTILTLILYYAQYVQLDANNAQ